jgi:starvation-inducible DNA-binding protein
VKGPHFISLHELFDGLAGALAAPIDDMAERIMALGGTADLLTGLSQEVDKQLWLLEAHQQADS